MKITEVELIAKDQAVLRLEDGTELEITVVDEDQVRSLMVIVQGDSFEDVTISQVRGRGLNQ